MAAADNRRRFFTHRACWLALGAGVLLTLAGVLASGFAVEATSTSRFCDRCHVMTPFYMAWKESVHGGKNPQGFAAQCVDCHLPQDNFVDYLVTKAETGTSDVVHNMTIDPATYDWAGNAKRHRREFTYDSACRRCHRNMTPPGIPFGGFIAHRAYLLKETGRHCVDCHPRVGHKDLFTTVDAYFHPQVAAGNAVAQRQTK